MPAPRSPRDWIEWPFFGPPHRDFAARLDEFVGSPELDAIDHTNVDAACRRLARELGRAGLLEAENIGIQRRLRLNSCTARR